MSALEWWTSQILSLGELYTPLMSKIVSSKSRILIVSSFLKISSYPFNKFGFFLYAHRFTLPCAGISIILSVLRMLIREVFDWPAKFREETVFRCFSGFFLTIWIDSFARIVFERSAHLNRGMLLVSQILCKHRSMVKRVHQHVDAW